jgi:ABC-type sugar transport system ATPase subunit
MPNLDRLSKFNTPGKRMSFKSAKDGALKPRKNNQISKGGQITQNYLGFDALKSLDAATAQSNAGLLDELAKLEQKTKDMGVAAEALQRKATQLADQAVLKSDTLKHCLAEASKLGVADNQANTAVTEFLNKMGIAHTKADNKEALSSMSANIAHQNEQFSFQDRVRALYQGQQQRAIDYSRQQEMREAARLGRTMASWQNGKVDTSRAAEAYRELNRVEGGSKRGGGMFAPLQKTLASVFN